jgi:hypothetical protein
MAHQHMLHGVLFVEGIVNVQYGTAGVTPNELHALGLKTFDEDFRAAQILRGGIRRSCRGELGFSDFHDQPFDFSLTKNVGCSLPTLVGPRRNLEHLAMGSMDAPPDQDSFAF